MNLFLVFTVSTSSDPTRLDLTIGATEFAGVENAGVEIEEEIGRMEKAGVRSMECRIVLKAEQHLFTVPQCCNCH